MGRCFEQAEEKAIRWCKIVQIERLEADVVYDLTTSSHNFFANNVLVHNCDHAPFAPLDPKVRSHIREMLDWEDKLVVGFFGTNKRVKNFPVLIRAMRAILERGERDVIMYFHTKAYDNHILQGWDLGNIIQMETSEDCPVEDHIYMPIKNDKWHGVAFDDTGIETWKLTRPTTREGRCMLLSSLPLITRYGLLDVYFDASAAEGHGLPVLEAAACGVPTVTVDDTVARSEIHARYCHTIKPRAWEAWHTGTDLAILDPDDIASMILSFKNNPDLARRGFEDNPTRIMQDLPWETTAQFFIDTIMKAAQK